MNFLEKEEQLPEKIRDYFRSNDSRVDLEMSCFLFDIKNEDIKNISSPVGLIFVGELRAEQLPNILAKSLNVPINTVYGLSYEINKRIFNQFPDFFTDSQRLLEEWAKQKSEPIISKEEAWQKVLELEPWLKDHNNNSRGEIEIGKKEEPKIIATKMPLSEILKTYPTAGEQLVSKNHIKLKIFPEPVRPSVKNWITDYTETLGYDRHTSMQRGEYLFKSENGKTLDSEDRGKVSQLLKSFDDSEGLEINTEKKQIIFKKNIEPETPQEKPASTPFQAQTGAYCRYAPPAPSDTKFHSELPNQMHLKSEPPVSQDNHQLVPDSGKNTPETEKPLTDRHSASAPQDDSFTVNLKQPMRIHPVTNGHTFGNEKINPDNVVNLKK